MADCDQVIFTNLVKSIEQYPCLYNFNLPEYSNKVAVEKAWKIVAKETGMSVVICKDKWRNIRTVFSRDVKRRRFGKVKKKPYYLQESLEYLVPFVKASHTTAKDSQFQEEKKALTEMNIKEDSEASNDESISVLPTSSETRSNQLRVSTSSSLSTSSALPSQSDSLFGKRNMNSENYKSNSSKNESYMDFDYNLNGLVPTENSRKMFLLSLLYDVESMTDLQYRKFRIEVLSLVDNILINSSQSQEIMSEEHIKIEIDERNKIMEE